MSGATVGVGVVVTGPDQAGVLFGWRVRQPATPCWCLPGGRAEPGESFEAAALRELAEEAGVRATAARPFVAVLDRAGPAVHVTIGVEVVVGPGTQPVEGLEPHTFTRWRWRAADDAEPMFPASRHLLDAWLDRPAAPSVHRYRLG
ncbi:NUDIX domain-containing protein [Actinoplanes sp. NPDC026619]|uniref:NUDIX domain-containing protein n=1 Tax=Actinoplanes sp. NPDC026619 TaxID=3155798 RepID=UPI0033C8F933